MKKALLAILLVIASVGGTVAQSGQGTQTQLARKIFSGTGVPSLNCNPGPVWRDVYIRTTTGVWYQCTGAPNTWAELVSGAAANATVGRLPYLSAANTFADSPFFREDANTVSQRNGVNGQTFKVASTYTDASNNLTLNVEGGPNYGALILRGVGTGVADNDLYIGNAVANAGASLIFQTQGASRWVMGATGHLTTPDDNTYDIGASGATRPRSGYFGTDVTAGAAITAGTRVKGQTVGFFNGGSPLGHIFAPADGVWTFYNDAQTTFGRIQFGGTTTSFPALKRSGAELHVRLADDSAYGNLTGDTLIGDTFVRAHEGDVMDVAFFSSASAAKARNNDNRTGLIQGNNGPTVTLASGGSLEWNNVAAGGADAANPANNDVGLARNDPGILRVTDAGSGWGKLLNGAVVTPKTSDYTVTANEVGTFFNNTGAAGAVVYTLPTPVVGMTYEFYRDANQAVTVDVTAGITIRVGASVTTSGGNVTLDAVGSRIRIVAISTTQWVGDMSGTLTFN